MNWENNEDLKDLIKYEYMITNDKDFKRNPIFHFGIEFGRNWLDLTYELLDIIYNLDTQKRFTIFQIKEKFGEFRFYYSYKDNNGDDIFKVNFDDEIKSIEEIINTYTDKINNMCEQCGKPGERRFLQWIQTLCDTCHEEKNNDN